MRNAYATLHINIRIHGSWLALSLSHSLNKTNVFVCTYALWTNTKVTYDRKVFVQECSPGSTRYFKDEISCIKY